MKDYYALLKSFFLRTNNAARLKELEKIKDNEKEVIKLYNRFKSTINSIHEDALVESYKEFISEGFKPEKPKFLFLFQIFSRTTDKDGTRERHEVKVNKGDNLEDKKAEVLKDYPKSKYFYRLFKVVGGGQGNLRNIETNESLDNTLIESYDEFVNEIKKYYKRPSLTDNPRYPFFFQIFSRKDINGETESHKMIVNKDDDVEDKKAEVLQKFPKAKYYYTLYKKVRGGFKNIETNESLDNTLIESYDEFVNNYISPRLKG